MPITNAQFKQAVAQNDYPRGREYLLAVRRNPKGELAAFISEGIGQLFSPGGGVNLERVGRFKALQVYVDVDADFRVHALDLETGYLRTAVSIVLDAPVDTTKDGNGCWFGPNWFVGLEAICQAFVHLNAVNLTRHDATMAAKSMQYLADNVNPMINRLLSPQDRKVIANSLAGDFMPPKHRYVLLDFIDQWARIRSGTQYLKPSFGHHVPGAVTLLLRMLHDSNLTHAVTLMEDAYQMYAAISSIISESQLQPHGPECDCGYVPDTSATPVDVNTFVDNIDELYDLIARHLPDKRLCDATLDLIRWLVQSRGGSQLFQREAEDYGDVVRALVGELRSRLTIATASNTGVLAPCAAIVGLLTSVAIHSHAVDELFASRYLSLGAVTTRVRHNAAFQILLNQTVKAMQSTIEREGVDMDQARRDVRLARHILKKSSVDPTPLAELAGQLDLKDGSCLWCGKTATVQCTRCVGPYCSQNCQRHDFKLHKGICKLVDRLNDRDHGLD